MIQLDYELTDAQVKQVRRFIKGLKTEDPMPYLKCPYYDRCEDQICPMDPLSNSRIWYADEGLCLNPEFKKDKAVMTQKKLAKKNPPGYFTHGMLNREIVVRKGIAGIDPDVPETVDKRGQKAIDSLYAERERAWIASHPEITPEQKEKMRSKGMMGIEAIRRTGEVSKK